MAGRSGAPDNSPSDAGADETADAPDDSAPEDSAVDSPYDAGTDAPWNSCTSNATCGPTYYCDTTLGDCSGTGVCLAVPMYCSNICMPMCGCDNKTYCNSCYAALARVSINYSGTCE